MANTVINTLESDCQEKSIAEKKQVDRPQWQEKQWAFTAHLRDPEQIACPDTIEDRRMAIYRELLFNNVKSFIENGFPVLHALYKKQELDHAWLALVRQFFAKHRSRSPYFVDIPAAFLAFVQTQYTLQADDPPFLTELAHYEWLELALMTRKTEPDWTQVNRYGNLLTEQPILSPLAECHAYHWAVHTISPSCMPDEALAQPVFIIIYRNAEDQVKFIEANPVTAHLFMCLQQNTADHITGEDLLTQIAEQLQHPNPIQVIQGGLQTLTRWHHLQIVLGTKKLGDAE